MVWNLNKIKFFLQSGYQLINLKASNFQIHTHKNMQEAVMEQESIVTYELAAKSENSKDREDGGTSELITARRKQQPINNDIKNQQERDETQILRESRTIPEMPKQNALAPTHHILSENSVSNKQSPKNTYLGMPIPSLSQLDEKTENPLLQLEGRFHHDLHLEQQNSRQSTNLGTRLENDRQQCSATKVAQTKGESQNVEKSHEQATTTDNVAPPTTNTFDRHNQTTNQPNNNFLDQIRRASQQRENETREMKRRQMEFYTSPVGMGTTPGQMKQPDLNAPKYISNRQGHQAPELLLQAKHIEIDSSVVVRSQTRGSDHLRSRSTKSRAQQAQQASGAQHSRGDNTNKSAVIVDGKLVQNVKAGTTDFSPSISSKIVKVNVANKKAPAFGGNQQVVDDINRSDNRAFQLGEGADEKQNSLVIEYEPQNVTIKQINDKMQSSKNETAPKINLSPNGQVGTQFTAKHHQYPESVKNANTPFQKPSKQHVHQTATISQYNASVATNQAAEETQATASSHIPHHAGSRHQNNSKHLRSGRESPGTFSPKTIDMSSLSRIQIQMKSRSPHTNHDSLSNYQQQTQQQTQNRNKDSTSATKHHNQNELSNQNTQQPSLVTTADQQQMQYQQLYQEQYQGRGMYHPTHPVHNQRPPGTSPASQTIQFDKQAYDNNHNVQLDGSNNNLTPNDFHRKHFSLQQQKTNNLNYAQQLKQFQRERQLREKQRHVSIVDKAATSSLVGTQTQSPALSAFVSNKKSTPSVNRMLQDLKRLDYYRDPKAVLKNVNETLAAVQVQDQIEAANKMSKAAAQLRPKNKQNAPINLRSLHISVEDSHHMPLNNSQIDDSFGQQEEFEEEMMQSVTNQKQVLHSRGVGHCQNCQKLLPQLQPLSEENKPLSPWSPTTRCNCQYPITSQQFDFINNPKNIVSASLPSAKAVQATPIPTMAPNPSSSQAMRDTQVEQAEKVAMASSSQPQQYQISSIRLDDGSTQRVLVNTATNQIVQIIPLHSKELTSSKTKATTSLNSTTNQTATNTQQLLLQQVNSNSNNNYQVQQSLADKNSSIYQKQNLKSRHVARTTVMSPTTTTAQHHENKNHHVEGDSLQNPNHPNSHFSNPHTGSSKHFKIATISGNQIGGGKPPQTQWQAAVPKDLVLSPDLESIVTPNNAQISVRTNQEPKYLSPLPENTSQAPSPVLEKNSPLLPTLEMQNKRISNRQNSSDFFQEPQTAMLQPQQISSYDNRNRTQDAIIRKPVIQNIGQDYPDKRQSDNFRHSQNNQNEQNSQINHQHALMSPHFNNSIDAQVGEQTIEDHHHHSHLFQQHYNRSTASGQQQTNRHNQLDSHMNSIQNSLFQMAIDPHDSVIFDQNESNEGRAGFIEDLNGSSASIKDYFAKIQMQYYEEPKQYNHLFEESVRYPEYSHVKQLISVDSSSQQKSKALKLTNKRPRPAIDLQNMNYHDQKQFFRLDRQHEQTWIQQHEWKTKKTERPFDRALLIKLVKERKDMFRQFVSDIKQKHIQINKLAVGTKMPRISLTDKSVAFQSDRVSMMRQEAAQSAQLIDRLNQNRSRAVASMANQGAYRRSQSLMQSSIESIGQHFGRSSGDGGGGIGKNGNKIDRDVVGIGGANIERMAQNSTTLNNHNHNGYDYGYRGGSMTPSSQHISKGVPVQIKKNLEHHYKGNLRASSQYQDYSQISPNQRSAVAGTVLGGGRKQKNSDNKIIVHQQQSSEQRRFKSQTLTPRERMGGMVDRRQQKVCKGGANQVFKENLKLFQQIQA